MGCFKPFKDQELSDRNDAFEYTFPGLVSAHARPAGLIFGAASKARVSAQDLRRPQETNGAKSPDIHRKPKDDEDNQQKSTAASVSVRTEDYANSEPIVKNNGQAFGGTPLPLPMPDIINRAERTSGSSSASRPSLDGRQMARRRAVSSPNLNNNVNCHSSARAHGRTPWRPYASEPKPLPPPRESEPLRAFSWEELAGACQNFSPEFWCREAGPGPVYRASLSLDSGQSTAEVHIALVEQCKSFRKWEAELKWTARLRHPHISKVIGFCADAKLTAKTSRAVVYARMPSGCSLDGLLYGRKRGKPPLDWPSRLKIALGAAQGLATLHDASPSRVAYGCFQTLNVQVDDHFHAQLSDYCFANSVAVDDERLPYLAPETVRDGELSAKSNVWSFGVVVLELMTGRQNMDALFPVEDQNLTDFVRRRYLREERKVPHLIMDPELKGFYPAKLAFRLAELALRCLEEDPMQRPTMRHVANILQSLHNENPQRGFPRSSSVNEKEVGIISGRPSCGASKMSSRLSWADAVQFSLPNFSFLSKSVP